MENLERLKIILIGESKVGKTSIITQYCEQIFQSDYISTIGTDRFLKAIELENKTKVNLEIWDTVGQEEFSSTNKIFFKKSKIALLVYDITERKTFEKLPKWYKELLEVNNKNEIIIGVVANKSDLYEKQTVDSDEGQQFAKEINALFFETSAKDYECIEKVFKKITEEYYKSKKININPDSNSKSNSVNNSNNNKSSDSNKQTDVIHLKKPDTKKEKNKKCFPLDLKKIICS